MQYFQGYNNECIAMIPLDKMTGYITDKYFTLFLLISLCKLHPETSEDNVLSRLQQCIVRIQLGQVMGCITDKYFSLHNK